MIKCRNTIILIIQINHLKMFSFSYHNPLFSFIRLLYSFTARNSYQWIFFFCLPIFSSYTIFIYQGLYLKIIINHKNFSSVSHTNHIYAILHIKVCIIGKKIIIRFRQTKVGTIFISKHHCKLGTHCLQGVKS